jgi:ATP-dependent Clp protease protease subunit
VSSYLVPSVVEHTPRGDRSSDLFSRLLGERIIFVGTPIDDDVANVVIAQLLHLAAESPDQDIHLYINSQGGELSSTLAIYDAMWHVAPDVATLCVGQASATAAILCTAGAAGKRAILPHGRVLLVQPHVASSRGSISDLAVEATEVARMRTQTEAILARHTDKRAEDIRADTDHALVLAGQAAVDYGLVDEVLEPAKLASR